MSENGHRKPPRPRIEIVASPDPVEAAAVIAAVERFVVETGPAPEAAPGARPWQRASLLEGVRSKEAFASPWGEPRGWGARSSRAS